jgi:hypothetical protein
VATGDRCRLSDAPSLHDCDPRKLP